jgi:hypothetical protein
MSETQDCTHIHDAGGGGPAAGFDADMATTGAELS